jgi:hypothetical protein
MIIKVKTDTHKFYEINHIQFYLLKKHLKKQVKNECGILQRMKYENGNYYILINSRSKDYIIFLNLLIRYLDLFNLTIEQKIIE